jgi:hypothetical protein
MRVVSTPPRFRTAPRARFARSSAPTRRCSSP